MKSRANVSLIALVLSLSSAAFANPTVWNLTNTSGAAVGVHCASLQLQGLKSALSMDIASIPANGTASYKWTDIDNDGMGLNAGDWVCAINGRGAKSELRFHTQWDETVALTIKPQAGQLALTRSAGKSL